MVLLSASESARQAVPIFLTSGMLHDQFQKDVRRYLIGSKEHATIFTGVSHLVGKDLENLSLPSGNHLCSM